MKARGVRVVRDSAHARACFPEASTMTLVVEPFESRMQRGGDFALREVARFFMHDHPVDRSLRKITARLKDLEVPYAVAGARALVAHGYDRTTVDVDVLVAVDGLARVHTALDGLGYLPIPAGSRIWRTSRN